MRFLFAPGGGDYGEVLDEQNIRVFDWESQKWILGDYGAPIGDLEDFHNNYHMHTISFVKVSSHYLDQDCDWEDVNGTEHHEYSSLSLPDASLSYYPAAGNHQCQ